MLGKLNIAILASFHKPYHQSDTILFFYLRMIPLTFILGQKDSVALKPKMANIFECTVELVII